jgi:hypothetical protein
MPIHNRPVFTDVYDRIDHFTPETGSVYVGGTSVEERSEHICAWQARSEQVLFVDITVEERSSIQYTIDGDGPGNVALRSDVQITRF